MKNSKLTMLLYLLPLAFGLTHAQQSKSWVDESNEYTQLLLDVMARFSPESAAEYGIEGIDEDIIDVRPGFVERELAADQEVRTKLKKALETVKTEEVRQDIKILITAIDDYKQSEELNRKYFLPYYNISQLVYYSLQSLLDDQVAEERRPAALVRLKKYTGEVDGHLPVTELLQNHIEDKLKNEKLLGPVKRKMERDLENTPRYLAGIKELFDKFEIADYQDALNKLTDQLNIYESFLKEKVMPRARVDFRLPKEVYANSLKNYGVDMPVDEMVRRARVSFKTIQNEMNSLALMIAQKRGWQTSDYRQVLRNLKKEQILGEKILPLYEQRITELEKLATDYKVVSVPNRKMRIRLASEAESAAVPAPFMRPPRLIGNTGEMGEFVLPLKFPGEDLVIDDFTHEATTWTLAVHEGRPGHEMQFSALVENGISNARAIYAFNSVNVEGWALYMESEMKPYLPLEGQFGTLMALSIRSARAFLDPGLQMGELTKEEAKRVLLEDVVLSEALALQEIERYTFRAPGQATSYFVGYQRLLELRTDSELKLGDKFDRKAFNDFILAQGLIPPSLQRKAVEEKFIPEYLGN
jgi:hypothetical protein